MDELLQHTDVIKAITTSFIFQGAFLFIGFYMLLVYIQVRKKDYLLYGAYALLFAIYFFLRIDLMLQLKLLANNPDVLSSFLLPLLFLLTALYVKFINVFAQIKTHHDKFSREIDIFTYILCAFSALSLVYLIVTQNFEFAAKYQSVIFMPLHAYSIYAVVRAFLVIKSALRYYILVSNIFLITFTILGMYTASNVEYSQGIYANNLFGFYNFNASQLGVFLEMLCFSLGLGYKFNLIEIEKDKIKKLDEFKTKLYNNISHEFRTPLTLISGPIESQLAKPNLSKNDKAELSLIKRNAKRLLNLVNQLLDLSKLETGNLKLAVSKDNLTVLLKQLATAFEFKAKEKNIEFTYTIAQMKQVWFDKDVVEKIVSNLLHNAVKYTPVKGCIYFEASLNEEHVTFSVLNNGNQLKDEELPALFQRYYQDNKQSEGVGIGLSLVKELVALAHGNIVAHTLNQDEIQFVVTLPVARSYFNAGEIAESFSENQPLEEVHLTQNKRQENTVEQNEKPVLLIVEDDQDIRIFIKSIFNTEYKILEAANGKEGIRTGINQIPDIIISDVMMPLGDGIELCNTLKANIKTSHIPIVLLTAKSGDQNEIQGLKSGADAYVTKPFNSKKLKIQIERLIETPKKIQEYYRANHELDFHNIQVLSSEEQFLKTLQQALKENILQSNFNSTELSKLLHMSRMQLHRKLKALTGLSTSEFIKNERLKVAKTLLKKSDYTISEIAYQTGFNTPSYFIKCFKKAYNCTPSAYLSSFKK